jgi:hypothetical protein
MSEIGENKKQLNLPVAVLGVLLRVTGANLLDQNPAEYYAVPDEVRLWLISLLPEGEVGDFGRNELGEV